MSLTGYYPPAGLVLAFPKEKVSIVVSLAHLSKVTGVCFTSDFWHCQDLGCPDRFCVLAH